MTRRGGGVSGFLTRGELRRLFCDRVGENLYHRLGLESAKLYRSYFEDYGFSQCSVYLSRLAESAA